MTNFKDPFVILYNLKRSYLFESIYISLSNIDKKKAIWRQKFYFHPFVMKQFFLFWETILLSINIQIVNFNFNLQMKSCLFFLILEMCIISCYSNILVKPVSLLYFQKKIPWREFPVLFIILDSKKLLLIISEQCFAK